MCMCVCTWWSEDNPWESVHSFRSVGPETQAQPDNKSLDPLRNPAIPKTLF